MNLLFQDTYSELNRLSQHLGFDDWDSVPEAKRKEIHQFRGLLKGIEREFHNALFIQREYELEKQKNVLRVFKDIDALNSVKL